MSTLAEIVRDLEYAAGAGGARLGAEIARSGSATAELGVAVRVPGPGLKALGGTHVAQADGSQLTVPEVLDHMAAQAVDGGVDLALGRRR